MVRFCVLLEAAGWALSLQSSCRVNRALHYEWNRVPLFPMWWIEHKQSTHNTQKTDPVVYMLCANTMDASGVGMENATLCACVCVSSATEEFPLVTHSKIFTDEENGEQPMKCENSSSITTHTPSQRNCSFYSIPKNGRNGKHK